MYIHKSVLCLFVNTKSLLQVIQQSIEIEHREFAGMEIYEKREYVVVVIYTEDAFRCTI